MKSSKLNVLIISSGLNKCGINDYTNRLLEQMNKYKDLIDIHQIRITDEKRSKPWSFLKEIIKKITNKNLDIIHIQHEFSMYDNFYGISIIPLYLILWILSKFNKFKIVTTLHTVWDLHNLKSSINPKIANSLLFPLVKFYILYHIKLVCSLSDKVIVLGAPSVKILENQYNIEKIKIEYIPLGVYNIRLQHKLNNNPKEIKKKFNLSNSKVITLFGFFYPSKGYHYVIQALPYVIKEIKNIKLVLAGGIPSSDNKSTYEYYTYLKRLVKSLNLEKYVVFTGFLPDEELFELFELTDVFIFPYENRVNASAAINTVLPYKKPIIVSESPLFEELVSYNAVIVANVKDKKDLSDKILLLLKNKELSYELSTNIEKYIEKNSIASAASSHLKLYQSVRKE